MRILSRVLADLAARHAAVVLSDERDCRLIFPGLTESLAVELHEELRRRLAGRCPRICLRHPSLSGARLPGIEVRSRQGEGAGCTTKP